MWLTKGSILSDIKELLGVSPDETAFDVELILHINSALMVLYQIGYGTEPFVISGDSETWDDLLGRLPGGPKFYGIVRTYLGMKVRLMFDPPQSGVLHEAMERQVEELEWRASVQASTPFVEEGSNAAS